MKKRIVAAVLTLTFTVLAAVPAVAFPGAGPPNTCIFPGGGGCWQCSVEALPFSYPGLGISVDACNGAMLTK